jgi:hypothetical protein
VSYRHVIEGREKFLEAATKTASGDFLYLKSDSPDQFCIHQVAALVICNDTYIEATAGQVSRRLQ